MERTMAAVRRWMVGAALVAGLGAAGILPAQADGTSHRTAFVEATDLSRSTVTLDGHTYRVGSQTRLLGRGGEPITLRDLRAGAQRDGAITTDTADVVEFELQPPSEVLDSLRVVDMMPR
jgi:hypothetical protein